MNDNLKQMSQIPLPGFEANTPEEMIQAMERSEDILQDEIDFRQRLLALKSEENDVSNMEECPSLI